MDDDKQWQKAEQLAARLYFTVIYREEIDKEEPYYVAVNPDLPGCRADGNTPEEAKRELVKARVDYIYFLLEDNLPVPEPRTYEVKSNFELLKEAPLPHTDYIVEELPQP